MHRVTRQLEQVRRQARVLLTAQRMMQFVTMAVVVALVLSAVDYAMNLPGWLRLIIGVFVLGDAVFWVGTRLVRSVRFNPSLGELALRAERLYPQVAGVLASSVEFAAASADTYPGHGAVLADLAVRHTQKKLAGVELSRLIDRSSTVRRLGVMLAALLVLVGVVVSVPGTSRTAAARWLMPLGETQWPRTVLIEDTTALDVWPVDMPPRLVAQIHRGYRPGMRVNVRYRLTDAQGKIGPWRQALMTEQAVPPGTDRSAKFERLIDIPPLVVRSVNDHRGGQALLTYEISAGDDQTNPKRVTLVARPTVAAVHAAIHPPVYAAGLVGDQDIKLHEQSGYVASITALIGSSVRLGIVFNKPVAVTGDNLADVLPGLIGAVDPDRIELNPVGDPSSLGGVGVTLSFRLDGTFQTPIRVVDEHGLKNISQRRYRIEAVQDNPPTVSMTEPVADEAVLATAEVAILARAQDDVGLERIELAGLVRTRRSSGEPTEKALPSLGGSSGRQASLSARARLDLSTLELEPGDEVVLWALASDVFELDGRRHDPVRSAPRSLRIIDEPTLISQMRNELAGLRQQVVRLEQDQQRIETERPPSVAQPQQERVTRRLSSQAALLKALEDRARRNRLDDPTMSEMIRRADDLIEQARQYSGQAAGQLRQAVDQPDAAEDLLKDAQHDQESVRQTLTELAELLDQGRDVLTLKLQLQQLKTQQQSLANDTRELLPQTIGQDKDQLTEAQRDQLKALSRRQDELKQQAQALTRQMQATAEALARQGERDQDRAAAEALAEAAAIGLRQGLSESMGQSSKSMQENQLSQSSQQQDRALDALDKMIDEMGTQEKRRQAILRRRLRELSQLIRALLERQETQVSILEKTDGAGIPAMEPDQSSLRRATMGAQQQAAGSPEAAQVGVKLGEAVTEQGTAIGAMRIGERPAVLTAQNAAVEHLRAALDELNKIVQDEAQQRARKQRQALRQAYEKHAQRQDELQDQVRGLTDAGPLDRRGRAALMAVAGEQSQLQQAIAQTGQQVDQTLVFEYLHNAIGASSSRVVSQLRRGVGDPSVQDDQGSISTTLRVMAEALKEEPNDDPFAGQQAGGGGGGGGQEPPLIPPLAELKLIRGIQQVVYDQTRLVESTLVGEPDEPMKQRMLELSTQQRELAGLGERLIEKMKQRSHTEVSKKDGR